MKDLTVLLVGINAKFIHSNLAIRYLQRYAEERGHRVAIEEYTINQHLSDVADGIVSQRPDILGFSCYIWNIEWVSKLAAVVKRVLPDCRIVLGGPEVSYQKGAGAMPYVDAVVSGEGEEAFVRLLEAWKRGEDYVDRPGPGMDMGLVPFIYEGFDDFAHRIIYYETSRGCPYNCQYCLSSIEKGVRFRPLDLVFRELQHFLDHRLPQVKFVDRTFNAKKSHAMAIWQYLMDHDNGVTNFHFEITGDILDDGMVEALAAARPGLFQFEIGVQSTNEKTIVDIDRKVDFGKLARQVLRLKEAGNIHLHLDLIAGLPDEDYEAFGRSFDDVMALAPEQLQLGFLKVLKGSAMEAGAAAYGIVYTPYPPYEVLSTGSMSYWDLSRLKGVEAMLETFYNSGNFLSTMPYLTGLAESPFRLYEKLWDAWKQQGLAGQPHNKMRLYEFLHDWGLGLEGVDPDRLGDLLLIDWCLQEKPKKYPSWVAEDTAWQKAAYGFYKDEGNISRYLAEYAGLPGKQISRMAHIEKLSSGHMLFNYRRRSPMHGRPAFFEIKL